MNKYLLERYPLVWNTRLIPMLALASGGHIFFILLGLAAMKTSIIMLLML